MNKIEKSIPVKYLVMFAVMTGLAVPAPASAVEPIDDDIILSIPPIISAARKGIPEFNGSGIQNAAGPFYSDNGRLGGVIFSRVSVDISLRGGDTPIIIYHVEGDTPFNLPVENPPVPILTGPIDPNRVLNAPYGEPITFTGRGSRPLNGLTVPNGVRCTEITEVNLDVTRTRFSEWYATAEKLSVVDCRNQNGSVYDKIDGVETDTDSVVLEFIASY